MVMEKSLRSDAREGQENEDRCPDDRFNMLASPIARLAQGISHVDVANRPKTGKMAHMSATAKRQIIRALDDLPEQSLAAVAEFVGFLRAKAAAEAAAGAPTRIAALGGLWKGHSFSEHDIDEARREAWSGLGRHPS